MQKITLVLILCISFYGYTQELTFLKGKVVAEGVAVDAVHVINQTQSTGTISNASGDFKIKANKGDTIAFSSIQYALKQHIVTQEDLKNDSFKVTLDLSVNTLDEVRVTQYTLTGKIEEDVQKIPTYTENLPFWNAAELKQMGVSGFNDSQSPVKNLALEGVNNQLRTTIDLKLLTNLISGIFKRKNDKTYTPNREVVEYYSEKFIVETLEVPETKYYDFIDFINEQPQAVALSRSKDQLKILEYLMRQRDAFFEKYDINK